MGLVAALVVGVVLVATYLTWTAGRLDRLHLRADAAAAVLEAQLTRRASAAALVAAGGVLPSGPAARLAEVAGAALRCTGLGPDREEAESALSRALRDAAVACPQAFAPSAPAAADLTTAAVKVSLSRRFHADAVTGALSVRRRRIPRLLHLAGSAPWPSYFEIDDTVLGAVTQSPASDPAGGATVG